jgi:uncharacterized protein
MTIETRIQVVKPVKIEMNKEKEIYTMASIVPNFAIVCQVYPTRMWSDPRSISINFNKLGLIPMSLIDRIGENIKTAMKAKDKLRLETYRSIKKVLLDKEVSVRPSGQTELTPEQEIEALVQIAKQRRDAIEQYTTAGRADLAEKEAAELSVIEEFLPQQMTDEAVSEAIAAIVTQVGATSAKDMGKVMGVAMQQLKGKADGKKVQEMVKAKLSEIR